MVDASLQFSPQLHRYALDCLARREYCRSELQRKLAARGANAAAVEQLLAVLEHAGQLDEGRYAEAFVHARARRGHGPRRIRRELEQRGLERKAIDAALHKDTVAAYDWQERARQVRRKKFGDTPPGNLQERLRQMRYLEYRGFDHDMSAAALAEDEPPREK